MRPPGSRSGRASGPLIVAAGRLEWEKGFSTLLRALPPRAGGAAEQPAGAGRQPARTNRCCASWPPSSTSAVRCACRDRCAPGAGRPVRRRGRRGRPEPVRAVRAGRAGGPGRRLRSSSPARSAGSASLVEDGVTGRQFAPGDVDHLAAILESAARAIPPTARQLATAGRSAAGRRTWQRVARALAPVYDAQRPVICTPADGARRIGALDRDRAVGLDQHRDVVRQGVRSSRSPSPGRRPRSRRRPPR